MKKNRFIVFMAMIMCLPVTTIICSVAEGNDFVGLFVQLFRKAERANEVSLGFLVPTGLKHRCYSLRQTRLNDPNRAKEDDRMFKELVTGMKLKEASFASAAVLKALGTISFLHTAIVLYAHGCSSWAEILCMEVLGNVGAQSINPDIFVCTDLTKLNQLFIHPAVFLGPPQPKYLKSKQGETGKNYSFFGILNSKKEQINSLFVKGTIGQELIKIGNPFCAVWLKMAKSLLDRPEIWGHLTGEDKEQLKQLYQKRYLPVVGEQKSPCTGLDSLFLPLALQPEQLKPHFVDLNNKYVEIACYELHSVQERDELLGLLPGLFAPKLSAELCSRV